MSVSVYNRSQDPFTGLVSNSDYAVADALLCPLSILLACCGTITNSLNFGTFISMGIKDGITLSFLFLSFADFSFGFLNVIAGTGHLVMYFEREHGYTSSVSPFVLITVGHLMGSFASLVCITTVFIASLRCACVVFPLQFKSMFSKTKTGSFLGGCTLFIVGIYMPLMSGYEFLLGWDQYKNISRIVVVESSANNQDFQTAIWLYLSTIVLILAQVIVMVCVPILLHALRAASVFKELSQGSLTPEKGSKRKIEGKEAQVIAQVAFISVVFITCNFTSIVYCVAAFLEQEFYFGKTFNNIHSIVANLVIMALLSSGNINMFVYLKYNSSFRVHFVLKRLCQ